MKVLVALWLLCPMIVFPISATFLNNSNSSHSDSSGNFSPEVVRKESFVDWAHWKERYAQCNPEKNAYTSPIKITFDYTVPAPAMKALFVHSRMPVDDCLALTILHKEGNLEMEAVSIIPLQGCSHQLTQIYTAQGAGDAMISKRYFKRAIFFFAKDEPEKERSLHQINGQRYQMEILMEFVASNKKDRTQIFILVEVKPPGKGPANPIFTVLESALHELEQKILDEASMKTERALKFKVLQDACSRDEKDYIKTHEATKYIIDNERLKSVEKIIHRIKGISNDYLKKLIENDTLWISPNNITANIQKLEQQKLNLHDMMQKETEPWAFDKLQNLYLKVENAIGRMENDSKAGSSTKLERIRNFLKENKIGIPGEKPFPGMLYESPDAAYTDLLEIEAKIEEYNKAAHRYNKSCQDFLHFQKQPYALVKINQPFQISWLFPDTGGYYMYNGSNPIPECEPRNTTIVLKEPISISSEQLLVFQNLPSLDKLRPQTMTFDNTEIPMPNKITNASDWKVDIMMPILYDGDKSRRIWYVPKSLVFLNDDGFHKKSARLRQLAENSNVKMLSFPWTVLFLFYIDFCL